MRICARKFLLLFATSSLLGVSGDEFVSGAQNVTDYRSSLRKRGAIPLQDSSIQRELQTRACGSPIGVTTRDEIKEIGELYLGSLSDATGGVIRALINQGKYDIVAIKVCLSCSEVDSTDVPQSVLSKTSAHGFATYCGSGDYGSSATHSAVMFAPLKQGTTDTILDWKMRAFVYNHMLEIEVDRAPSMIWPDDVTAELNSGSSLGEKQELFANFFPSIVLASYGGVAVNPDYIGYGESDGVDRAFLAPAPYQQATSLSFLAAKQYIASTGCAILDNVATVAGYGEGGYAAVVGAMALGELGVQVLSVHSGGAPYEPDIQSKHFYDVLTTADPIPQGVELMTPYFGYSYSNGFPFMANTGANGPDSKYLADNYKNQIVGYFDAPDTATKNELLNGLPDPLSSIMHANLISMYAAAGTMTSPCRGGNIGTDICTAMLENGLWETLKQIPYDTWICHSPNDEVVPIAQATPLLSGFSNSKVKPYTPSVPSLTPKSDHFTASVFCGIDPIYRAFNAAGNSWSPVYKQQIPGGPDSCAPTAAPPPTPKPTSPPAPQCKPQYAACQDSDECCPGFYCKLRVVGQPMQCSSEFVLKRSKTKLAPAEKGGAARIAKGI